MAIIEGNIIKADSIIKIDGGQLVLNLGGSRAKIGPYRIGLFLVGVAISGYLLAHGTEIWMALIVFLVWSTWSLFGNLKKIGKNTS